MMAALQILLIEDSPDDAELIELALRREGKPIELTVVAALDEVRDALLGRTWDVILADFSLRGFTAREALGVLRESGKDIPFIVVSGSIGEETAVSLMKAGASDFFLKDRITRLGAAIERELREAEVRRERRDAMARLEESERQLRQAVHARDEFLAIASHELKTPLTPLELQLSSALELVRGSRQDNAAACLEKLAPKLDSMRRQVTRLSTLVSNLLDVTTITSGRLEISRQRVDLPDLVGVVVARSQDAIHAARSEVLVRADRPVEGLWDPIAVDRMVTTLLSNALKFGEGKPVEIDVRKGGAAACLSVTDHGIGIASDAQARIFERFERAVPSNHYGGFGIGLWLTRQMATAHGGDVRVTSRRGEGSTFTIELPLDPGEQRA